MSYPYANQQAIQQLRSTSNAWFHPHISRADGARILEGRESGSFILRESSKGGNYALSVVLPTTGSLGHYLVEKRGPGCFSLQGSENSFVSLEELLAHYCNNDSIGMPCRLKIPLPRRQMQAAPAALPPSKPALPPRNSIRGHPTSPTPMRPGRPSVAMPIPAGPLVVPGNALPSSFTSGSPASGNLHPALCSTASTSSVASTQDTDEMFDEEYADMSSISNRSHTDTNEMEEEEYADMSSMSRRSSKPPPVSTAHSEVLPCEDEYADMSCAGGHVMLPPEDEYADMSSPGLAAMSAATTVNTTAAALITEDEYADMSSPGLAAVSAAATGNPTAPALITEDEYADMSGSAMAGVASLADSPSMPSEMDDDVYMEMTVGR